MFAAARLWNLQINALRSQDRSFVTSDVQHTRWLLLHGQHYMACWVADGAIFQPLREASVSDLIRVPSNEASQMMKCLRSSLRRRMQIRTTSLTKSDKLSLVVSCCPWATCVFRRGRTVP